MMGLLPETAEKRSYAGKVKISVLAKAKV